MRRYDDPVEVRRGQVSGVEAPEQFLWRGRLWKVRAVLAHWVETGPRWQAAGAAPPPAADLTSELELWRVEAGRGLERTDVAGSPGAGGIFDLCCNRSADGGGGTDGTDGTDGRWQLVGCED